MSISLKRIEWENKPSKKTPLNKLNLEKMEQNTEDAVNEVDSKVNVLEQELEDTTKNYLRKSEDIVVILHYVAEKNDVDTIEYPKNFNMHNTVVLSVIEDANKGEYWKTADFHNDGIALTHHLASVELHSTNIKIQGNSDTYYRITLMRF